MHNIASSVYVLATGYADESRHTMTLYTSRTFDGVVM